MLLLPIPVECDICKCDKRQEAEREDQRGITPSYPQERPEHNFSQAIDSQINQRHDQLQQIYVYVG